MSTAAIVAIVVGVIVLVAIALVLARAASAKRRATHRKEAGELREQAQARTIQVESTRASADEKAARARRAKAEAEEKAAQAKRDSALAQQQATEAERQSEMARAHHDRARAVDPDVADDGEQEARALDEGADERRREDVQITSLGLAPPPTSGPEEPLQDC
jgi:FtsZ-interacting cell division protein ZipA